MTEAEEIFVELEDNLTAQQRHNRKVKGWADEARLQFKPICHACIAIDRENNELRISWKDYECTELLKDPSYPKVHYHKKTGELLSKDFVYQCNGREEWAKDPQKGKRRIIVKHKVWLNVEKHDLEKVEGKKK